MTLAVSQMLKALLGAGVESPAALLTLLDEKIRETFYSSATEAEQLYAGLDMALITVRRSNRQLTFAGARLPLLLLRRGAINELSGCRRSIGYGGSHRRRFRQLAFTDRTIGIEPGDRLFLSSDGFFDQHGSDNPEPFGIDQVAALLAATAGLSLQQQEAALLNGFNRYRGEERQRDDITVIGLEL